MNIVVSELLDELWTLLSQSSGLAGLYESGNPEFVSRLNEWFVTGESVLKKHRRSQISEIAALRAQLIAASEGVFDIRYTRLPATGGTRKTHRAVAALLFSQAQVVLGNLHESFTAKLEEGAKYTRQMVALSLQKEIFDPAWSGGTDRGGSLIRVWQTLEADPDTRPAARHVLSLLSYPDALRMIDEVVTEWKLD